MKFTITAVPLDRKTRKRAGNAQLFVIDTSCVPYDVFTAKGLKLTHLIERLFEQQEGTSMTCYKVIDIRPFQQRGEIQ